MPRVIATHEVDDVAHWLASPKRGEVFGDLASDVRTFVDPERPGFVGLSMDIPDLDAFQAMLQSEAGLEAMRFDGVRAETIRVLIEG